MTVSTVLNASTAIWPTNTGQASGKRRSALSWRRGRVMKPRGTRGLARRQLLRLAGSSARGGLGLAREAALGIAVEAPGRAFLGDAAPGGRASRPATSRSSACTSSKVRPQPLQIASPWLVEQMAMQARRAWSHTRRARRHAPAGGIESSAHSASW
jgi:hypothetical protein